ncbi:hypothetical protein ABZ815_24060 [Nonomuraea sp. NPDC047529]|uniref:hypothetical protein n=1 Tax=Nonomuraea sp. NPDC047529 TaxID=3155623 RepID=UPI00340DC906
MVFQRLLGGVLGLARGAAHRLGQPGGGGHAIAFDALTYLLAAGCLARLSLTAAPASPASGILADIRDGWTEFRRIRWVWTVSVCFCVVNLVQVGTWQILGPVLTRRLSGEETWGFVLSARGVGMLVMSALVYRLVVRHLLRLGQLMSALGAVPLLALGAHLDALWLIAIPIGQLGVGLLADRFDGYQVAATAGIVYAAAAVLPLASAAVRRLPHAQDDHALSSR